MKSAPKIFLLDMDGCVADTVNAVLRLVSEELGTTLREDDWTDYMHPAYPREACQRIFTHFRDPDFYARPHLYPGAKAALELARSRGAQLHFATDRPPQSEEVTRCWLEANRLPFDSLRVGPMAKQGVLDAFPDQQITVIEDNPEWVRRHSDRIRVNLMDRAWTRDVGAPEFLFQWSEMSALLAPTRTL